MSNNTLYSQGFKALKWDDFNFKKIKINTFPVLENPDHHKNSFIFRDVLIKAIERVTNKKVFKLLFITPNYKSITKFYGISYSEDKIVFTFEIENTSPFKEWFLAINDKKEKATSTIYEFSYNSFISQPESNFKDIHIYKDTGAVIEKFIPYRFIAEELAKEKADYLVPFIQLNVEEDFDIIKKEFENLLASKNLKVHPPITNDKIYLEFEKEAGYAFPKLLKDFFKLHNGVEGFNFLNAQQVLEIWKEWNIEFEDWRLKELLIPAPNKNKITTRIPFEGPHHVSYLDLSFTEENDEKTLPMFMTPYWIPFLKLEDGNYAAIDFAPNILGKAGQVICFSKQKLTVHQKADSLSAFLKNLTDKRD